MHVRCSSIGNRKSLFKRQPHANGYKSMGARFWDALQCIPVTGEPHWPTSTARDKYPVGGTATSS